MTFIIIINCMLILFAIITYRVGAPNNNINNIINKINNSNWNIILKSSTTRNNDSSSCWKKGQKIMMAMESFCFWVVIASALAPGRYNLFTGENPSISSCLISKDKFIILFLWFLARGWVHWGLAQRGSNRLLPKAAETAETGTNGIVRNVRWPMAVLCLGNGSNKAATGLR